MTRDISNIKRFIDKVKNIVTYFKQSVVATDKLRKAQFTNPLKLLQDVSTPWNSTFYMLERFFILIESVSSCLTKLPKLPKMLTVFEVATLNKIIKMLKPFELVSKKFTGKNM